LNFQTGRTSLKNGVRFFVSVRVESRNLEEGLQGVLLPIRSASAGVNFSVFCLEYH